MDTGSLSKKSNFDDKVLEIDALPGILDYKYADGSSIWLTVRFDLRMMNFNNSTLSVNNKKSSNVRLSFWKNLKYIIFTFLKAPIWNTKKVDVLSIANYENSTREPNIWTLFLKEIDFLKSRELLYSHQQFTYHGIKNTYSLDYFFSKVRLKYLLQKKFSRKRISNQNIEDVINIISSRISEYITEKDIKYLKEKIYYIDGLICEYRRGLKNYINKVRPRMIVCSEGNNGDWRYCVLFSIAKELGIKTAEVQHGALGLGMKFHNDLVEKSDFKKHKSDFLFTFGSYHNSRTNAAGINIALGNYKLDRVKLNFKENTASKNKSIICIISEGIPATSPDNRYIQCLINLFSDEGIKEKFNLIIRLHPSEKPSDKYSELIASGLARYSFYETEPLFDLLINADAIIGHTSTVLFEALYFNKTPLIFHDNVSEQYVPKGLGLWFTNHLELGQLLQTSNMGIANVSEYWQAGGFTNNFISFYNSQILKST